MKTLLTKKEIIQDALTEERNTLVDRELRERFLQRKRLGNSSRVDPLLGQLQGEVRMKKEYIAFLEEVLEEETKAAK